MIARLSVLLPIRIAIPEGTTLTPATVDSEFGRLTIYPPVASIVAKPPPLPDLEFPLMSLPEQLFPASPQVATDEVLMDGKKTILADLLRLEYRRENFCRDAPVQGRAPSDDPPVGHGFSVLNGLLRRLRSAGQVARIREIDPSSTTWRLDYLSDDETALEPDDRYIRMRAGVSVRIEMQGLIEPVWDRVRALPLDYSPPPWDTLLLDAELMLPQVGPPLVLAATAVETVASAVVDHLAAASPTPPGLWAWLNDRGPLKNPNVEEQCGDLLNRLAGRSLKDDGALWEAFRGLTAARNRFVHEGVAKVAGKPMTHVDAEQLLVKAKAIVRFLEQFLPESIQRPIVETRITWSSRQMLRLAADEEGQP